MSGPKLFVVEITYTGIVLAKSEAEAAEFAEQIKGTECEGDEHIAPLGEYLPAGWDEHTLIYHKGKEDLTVKAARDAVKSDE